MTFFLGCLLVLCLSAYAGTYSGKVSDLDAGNDYLTVTNPDNQTTQTFKVTSETIILTLDGKPSQLLDLIEGTRVAVDADPVPEKSLPRSPSWLMHPLNRPNGPVWNFAGKSNLGDFKLNNKAYRRMAAKLW